MFDWGDRLREMQGDIKQLLIDQAAIKEDLRHHIKRTDKLEEALRPIDRHVAHVEGVFKLLGVLALLGTIVGSAYALLFS